MQLMDEESRTKIMEFMAPKTAGDVLVIMDELAAEMKTKKVMQLL